MRPTSARGADHSHAVVNVCTLYTPDQNRKLCVCSDNRGGETVIIPELISLPPNRLFFFFFAKKIRFIVA